MLVMHRAALYARVSTRRQEQEATIESQLDRLLSYAQQRGYDLPAAHHFVDQAVSGQRLARRGLDRLRDAAAAGDFQVLLCLSPDRLARNLGAQQVILNELRQADVTVVFLDQPDLADSPQAQLLLNIQGAFAEYERVVISERMRRGRLYRLRQGQSAPYPVPYGYRFQPSTATQPSCWVVVEAEAEIVKQMFAWYTIQRFTLGQIAQRLNQQGVPAPAGTTWTATTVGRIVRHSAYRGTTYFGRYETDASSIGQPRKQGQGHVRFPRYRLRPAEQWIEITVPAIVSEAEWQAAQEQRQVQAQFARRNSRREYLLRGLLCCGVCGHTLQGRTQQGVVTYACTYGGAHCPPGVPRHTCTVRSDVVEPLIWQALADLLQDPQRIYAAWETLQGEAHVGSPTRDRAPQRQAALQKQRQRLIDAYQAGVLTLVELTERQNPLELELRELRKHLADTPPPAPDAISLAAFTQQIEHALTACDLKTRQEVLRLLIERIVVTDDALTVEHIVPAVNDSRLHDTCRET